MLLQILFKNQKASFSLSTVSVFWLSSSRRSFPTEHNIVVHYLHLSLCMLDAYSPFCFWFKCTSSPADLKLSHIFSSELPDLDHLKGASTAVLLLNALSHPHLPSDSSNSEHNLFYKSTCSDLYFCFFFFNRKLWCCHCSDHYLYPASGHLGQRALLPLQKRQDLQSIRKKGLVSLMKMKLSVFVFVKRDKGIL